MQVLVVNPCEETLPEGTVELIRENGWAVAPAPSYRAAIEAASTGSIDAVVLPGPVGGIRDAGRETDCDDLLRLIEAQRIAAVVVTDHPEGRPSLPGSLIDSVGSGVSLAELRGRLAMIEKYHHVMRRMERELNDMQRLGKHLNQHFHEVDQEMRLAGRLQRDFLPRLDGPIDGIKFTSIYRPVSWVSGDMFDVFRIDEDTTGFYVADAVGHGMAAGLLTMFIKRAIVSERVEGDRHAVLTPSETLSALNDALTEQSLPNCQFVTACYGQINHRTLTLRYARGGHPYPVLITSDGDISELVTSGGLLGIFKNEEFPTFETQLNPGDRLLLYTDGVETAFQAGAAPSLDSRSCRQLIAAAADQPIESMLRQLEAQLDRNSEWQTLRDDITVVGLEILRR